jgi:signal transduction histidine kinase
MRADPALPAPPVPARKAWLRPREVSLNTRLTLLAVLPAALVAMLVAGFLTQNYRSDVERVTTTTAQAVADNLAGAAASAMSRGDRAELARIAAPLAANPDVVRVQFLSDDGEILAEAQGPEAGARIHQVDVRRDVRPSTGVDDVPGQVRVQFGLQRMDDVRRQQVQRTALLLMACLALAGLVGWRMARRMGAPVVELTRAVDQLGHGARGVRVPVTRGGEIGHLQHGFNATSLALTAAWEEMESRIADATSELAHKNARLEAAGLARARFLAAASHDLRQPLYALTLFSSALKVGVTDQAQLTRASHIQECVATLDDLFSELLDLSRLDSGAMQPAPSAFALDALLEEVNHTFRMVAEKRELRLVLRKTDVWVHTDRTMLARILNNLVSNALRYTAEGGVLVGVRHAGPGQVRVEVWDTGPGIAPELQARVFEEFFQVDTGRRGGERREYGLGLGLATVERLARLLGGVVRLRSTPGRGSVFSVSVPSTVAGAAMGSAPVVETPLDLSGLRVLVIDDEPSILEGMRMLLHSWGCEMRAAEDTAQALEHLAHWGPPEIVLSDLKLGGGRSGLEAMAALDAYYGVGPTRARPYARLIITGETKPEHLQDAVAARIPVMHKPVPPERLREAIMAAILAAQH